MTIKWQDPEGRTRLRWFMDNYPPLVIVVYRWLTKDRDT